MNEQSVMDRTTLITYFQTLLGPTEKYQQLGNGRFDFGSSAPHYSHDQAQIEGFYEFYGLLDQHMDKGS